MLTLISTKMTKSEQNKESDVINYQAIDKEVMLEPWIRIEKDGGIRNTHSEGYCKISKGTQVVNSRLGKYFNIGLYSFMQRCTCKRYVTIGSRVSVGAFSHPTNWLSTLEFQYRDSKLFYGETIGNDQHCDVSSYFKTTTIENDVWIGDNAVIQSGVKIGSGAIIANSAVVIKDIEPYCIVAGNPGKIIKRRFKEETIDQLLQLKWWELGISELEGIKFDNIEMAIRQLRERKGVQ